MDAIWIALGIVILVVTFLDTFLAVLNYDEAGLIVNRVVRGQWVLLRAVTQRVSRRWRPLVLRQVTGILLITTILGWICGLVLGFTFLYLGLIGLGAFQIESGVVPDFVGALYLSVGQFATVGADNISPAGGWVNLIPVLEALLSVVLLSFIITFLSNIYGVIQLLRSLCADFFQTGPGVGSPTEALRPYFPDGRPRDIDRHLNELADDFNLYCDSLRQDHAAYLFQSGEDQFSLPFALYMTSGAVAALTWGLPSGHDATRSPSLVRVREAFDDFRVLRYRVMRWREPETPAAVDAEQFQEAFAAFHAHASQTAIDPWVLRFLTMNREMAGVAALDGPGDAEDAYRRYRGWLGFAHSAEQFVSRVSRDLDYQPIYHGDPPVAAETPPPATRAVRGGGARAWLRRRLLFLDPGSLRLRDALSTLGAVVVAVLLAVAMSAALHVDATAAGVFAALIAVFAVPLAATRRRTRLRFHGLLALLPVGVGIIAGAFVPRDPVIAVVVLAVVAAAAIWVGRFGRLWAVCGQLAFLAYYFALLLAVSPADLVVALAAAGIGVVCAWLADLVPVPRGDRVARAAIGSVLARVSVLLGAAIDGLSGTGDRRARRILRADGVALRDSVTSLTRILDATATDGTDADERRTRQFQAFDVQLAADNLVRTLPAAGDALSVDVRARMAGELADLQRSVKERRRRWRTGGDPVADARGDAAPDPADAAALHTAIRELSAALDRLLTAPPAPAAGPATSDVVRTAVARPNDLARRATDRRAVQVGLSTGIALFLGGFISTSHQLWAALPAYQALTDSDGARAGRLLQRLIATVIGAAFGFGLALWTGHNAVVAFAVVVVSVFSMAFLRSVSPGWTTLWQTVLLATLYDLLARLTAEAIHVRIIETLIGAVVALIVAAVILPTRTRSRVLAEMAAFVAAAGQVTHAAIQRLADRGAGDVTAQDTLVQSEAAMQQSLDRVLQHARPLGFDPGALQRSGIQPQLTSLTALAFYARHLVAAAERTEPSLVGPARWQRIDGATRDNFQATLAVLNGRLPVSIREPVMDHSGAAAADADPAVSAVSRINGTLLAYMASVRPGSSDVTSATGKD